MILTVHEISRICETMVDKDHVDKVYSRKVRTTARLVHSAVFLMPRMNVMIMKAITTVAIIQTPTRKLSLTRIQFLKSFR